MSISLLRRDCREAIRIFADRMKLNLAHVLDVGVAGDPPPGENFMVFGQQNIYHTLDVNERYNPMFVGDIRKTSFPDGHYDLVILSNTLEHIWEYEKAIKEVFRITNKWAIIDCPFNYPYHAEDDFGDYWRFTHDALRRICGEAGFIVQEVYKTERMTSVLCLKV